MCLHAFLNLFCKKKVVNLPYINRVKIVKSYSVCYNKAGDINESWTDAFRNKKYIW